MIISNSLNFVWAFAWVVTAPELLLIDSFLSHGEAPYLKSSGIADYLNKLDENVAIACPIGRIPYVSNFDQAAANRAEIVKMEKYIVDLETERKTYFRRSQADKKKKIEAGKACFQINSELYSALW